jgi:hypothetical protein
MSSLLRTCAPLAGLLALAAPFAAQTPASLLQEGDTLIGIGGVTSLGVYGIDDARGWSAVVDTTFSDINRDIILLAYGTMTLREGMSLQQPAGAILDDFDGVDMTIEGHLAMTLRLRVPGQASLQEYLFWNLTPLANKGGPVSSPLVGAGTIWDGLNAVWANDANSVWVLGKIQNPIVPGIREDVLSRFDLDASGGVLDFEVLATKGQELVAFQNAPVNTLPLARTAYAFNGRGDALHVATTTVGSVVLLNLETSIAEEVGPSPVGRFWRSLGGAKVGLNDAGETVVAGLLDGDAASDFLIVKNGAKFVQEGDVLPELSPSPIGEGGTAPVRIANSGDVFWRASASGAVAFMRNQTPIVRQGSTRLGAALVTVVETGDDAFEISPNGRYFVGRVTLETGSSAFAYVDLGLILPIPGCHGNPGRLRVSAGAARVGASLTFELDQGHLAGALTRINFATRARVPGSECGVLGLLGESLLSPAHRVGSLLGPPWSGAGPVSVSVAIPSDLALIDATLFAQGSFRRPGSRLDVTLTNALRLEIGAP